MALTLTNADIIGRLTILADYYYKANSGSTTTAVNTRLADESDLSFGYVCFLSGDNKGLDRIITEHTDSTITFDALTTAVDSAIEFAIVEVGYLSYMRQARDFIDNYLRNKGLDLDLFLTESQLKELQIYKTIELACDSKMNDAADTDVYYANSEKYKKLFDLEINKLVADYDENESGAIETDEELAKIAQPRLVR